MSNAPIFNRKLAESVRRRKVDEAAFVDTGKGKLEPAHTVASDNPDKIRDAAAEVLRVDAERELALENNINGFGEKVRNDVTSTWERFKKIVEKYGLGDILEGAIGRDDVKLPGNQEKAQELVRIYTKLARFAEGIQDPSKYIRNVGHDRMRLMDESEEKNAAMKKQSPEKRTYPKFIMDAMKTRIEEDDAELAGLVKLTTVQPPYPKVEKQGKIVNLIPQGTCVKTKDEKKAENNLAGTNVGGRPTEVDNDLRTNSWNRDQKVNTHLSKEQRDELAERREQREEGLE